MSILGMPFALVAGSGSFYNKIKKNSLIFVVKNARSRANRRVRIEKSETDADVPMRKYLLYEIRQIIRTSKSKLNYCNS